jgi:hypothetical protein
MLNIDFWHDRDTYGENNSEKIYGDLYREI